MTDLYWLALIKFSFNVIIPDKINDGENVMTRENYTFFWRSSSPFSQWHPSVFSVHGVTFVSAEQFMMYAKAKLHNDHLVASKIISVNNSGVPAKLISGDLTPNQIISDQHLRKGWDALQHRIKRLGRDVSGFNENLWKSKRKSYVIRGSMEKFTQNPVLKDCLLATNQTILVEASEFDKIWGCGLSESDNRILDQSKWLGLNLLGDVLMIVRSNISSIKSA